MNRHNNKEFMTVNIEIGKNKEQHSVMHLA